MNTRNEAPGNNHGTWGAEDPEKSRDVRRHLEEIIASDFFKSSRRYPSFLCYVVKEALEGRGDQLKERTIGIEVFGRSPDYDTNLDHIVRSTATEVRKRLALYYQENGKETDTRIDLPPGSYVPVFQRNLSQKNGSTPFEPTAKLPNRRGIAYAVLVGVVLLLAGATIEFFVAPPRRANAETARAPAPSLLSALMDGTGQHLNAVIGDLVLESLNTQIAGNYVSLNDYRNRIFLSTDRRAARPNMPSWSFLQEANQRDIIAVSRIYHSVDPASVSVLVPGEFTDQDLHNGSTLLVGGPRANPWVQIFRNSMNFRTEVRTRAYRADLRNAAPRSGEKVVYSDLPAQGSDPGHYFGHIAYFPANSIHGKVLIVNAPSGSYAALCFATNPEELPRILRLLGVKQLNQLPSFELLLEFTGSQPYGVVDSKIVAFRRGREMSAVKETATSIK